MDAGDIVVGIIICVFIFLAFIGAGKLGE